MKHGCIDPPCSDYWPPAASPISFPTLFLSHLTTGLLSPSPTCTRHVPTSGHLHLLSPLWKTCSDIQSLTSLKNFFQKTLPRLFYASSLFKMFITVFTSWDYGIHLHRQSTPLECKCHESRDCTTGLLLSNKPLQNVVAKHRTIYLAPNSTIWQFELGWAGWFSVLG